MTAIGIGVALTTGSITRGIRGQRACRTDEVSAPQRSLPLAMIGHTTSCLGLLYVACQSRLDVGPKWLPSLAYSLAGFGTALVSSLWTDYLM
jgi:hypothetical protein